MDCIEWPGYITTSGYGRKYVGGGKYQYAHRLAWEEAHGPIPAGMQVQHHCDNPRCYNVAHLYLGTQAENMRDRTERGRVNSYWAKRTHCIHGHLLDEVNSYWDGAKRVCRACARERQRQHRSIS